MKRSEAIRLVATGLKMERLLLVAICLGLLPEGALAGGDPVAGEKISQRCLSCHSLTDKTNKTGPYLLGVVGRPVGTAEGYTYSNAMKSFAATGAVWDAATLDTYLANPKEVVPGTKMSAPPVRRETERADLIAFLKSQM